MREGYPSPEHQPLPATPENVASFLRMAEVVERDDTVRYQVLTYRPTPQFIRFYEAPIPTNLWMQHIEEFEKHQFRASHIIADKLNNLLIYTHEFAPEWNEGTTITPSSTLHMPKLSTEFVKNNDDIFVRDEIFSPISDEQFSHLYADIRWLYSGLRR